MKDYNKRLQVKLRLLHILSNGPRDSSDMKVVGKINTNIVITYFIRNLIIGGLIKSEAVGYKSNLYSLTNNGMSFYQKRKQVMDLSIDPTELFAPETKEKKVTGVKSRKELKRLASSDLGTVLGMVEQNAMLKATLIDIRDKLNELDLG